MARERSLKSEHDHFIELIDALRRAQEAAMGLAFYRNQAAWNKVAIGLSQMHNSAQTLFRRRAN